MNERTPCVSGKFDHHWVIESPTGPFSPGRCVNEGCGIEKEFRNYSEPELFREDLNPKSLYMRRKSMRFFSERGMVLSIARNTTLEESEGDQLG